MLHLGKPAQELPGEWNDVFKPTVGIGPYGNYADVNSFGGRRVRLWGHYADADANDDLTIAALRLKATLSMEGEKPTFLSFFGSDFLDEYDKLGPVEAKIFRLYAGHYDISHWQDDPFERRLNFEEAWTNFEVFSKQFASAYIKEAAKDSDSALNAYKEIGLAGLPDVGHIPTGDVLDLALQLRDDVKDLSSDLVWQQMVKIRILGPSVVNSYNFKYLAPHFLTPYIKTNYPYLLEFRSEGAH